MEDTLKFLSKIISIQTIIDVGAHHGEFYDLAKNIFPNSNIFSFEANPECKNYLESKNIPHKICLLGDSIRENVNFYCAKSSGTTGNSIYKELSIHFNNDNTKVEKLNMTTLDTEIGNITNVDILKIDVQGAELLVLEGAKETLKNTHFVLLKVSILKYNENSPLFNDVIKKMDEYGFNVYKICNMANVETFLVQVDVIFLKRTSKYVNTINEYIKSNFYFWKPESIY